MIIGFIGQRGSGKTLSMTIESYKKYLQGYTIYSNYKLAFPHKLFDIDDLLRLAESGEYLGNSIFIIDELHIWFDSRASGKKRNVIFSYFLNQSSKNDIDIYYTSQFSRQVEIRLRLNTEIVVESITRTVTWKTPDSKPVILENYRPKPNDYKCISYITNRITKFSDTGADKVVMRMYKGNKYFSLYNTKEVIKQQTDLFQRAKEDSKRKPTPLPSVIDIPSVKDDVEVEDYDDEVIDYSKFKKVEKEQKYKNPRTKTEKKRSLQHFNRLANDEYRNEMSRKLGREVL